MAYRLHSLAGLIPLILFIPFHLWGNWPALGGRMAWLDRERAIGTVLLTVIGLSFGISTLVHLLLWPRGADPRPPELVGSSALRQLQRATGIGVLLFLAYHLWHLRSALIGSELLASGAYDILWDSLGEPLTLSLYVFGIAALCFHLAHGLCRAAVTWKVLSRPSSVIAFRYAAAIAGSILWILTLQLISHFAIGQSLFR
jgi:succinate dehydrogenase / fumarate reductase, cytochrome b subunit